MTVIRYPFSEEFDRAEEGWEAPDALAAAPAERLAREPWAHRLLGWLCVIALALMTVATTVVVLG